VLNNLAKNRTILANERTFLAYIRTSIMLAVSGVTIFKFFGADWHYVTFGIALNVVAIAFVIFGFMRYKKMCRNITKSTMQMADMNEDDKGCKF